MSSAVTSSPGIPWFGPEAVKSGEQSLPSTAAITDTPPTEATQEIQSVTVKSLYESIPRRDFFNFCLVAIDEPQGGWVDSEDLWSRLKDISKSVMEKYKEEIEDQKTSRKSDIRTNPVSWIKAEILKSDGWTNLVKEEIFAPTLGDFVPTSSWIGAQIAMSFMVPALSIS